MKTPLRDLLTEFGQAYLKLCTEGAEHAQRVEDAETAISEAFRNAVQVKAE